MLILILILHALIISKLIFFPYVELFIYPYLTNHGLKPYSQILDQHFPGLMFFPINLNNLGMTNPFIARIWLMGIIILTHLLLFLVARLIFKNNKKALLVNSLYLIWQPFFEGWVLWIDSFLPLFLLPAFYFSIKRKYFLTGLFLAIGIVFKQTLIPLSVILFFYIIFEVGVGKSISYLFGLFIPVILMLGYIFGIGVWRDFWYWNIVFNLTVYTKSGTQINLAVGFLTRILFVYTGSLLGVLYKNKKIIYLLFIFLFGSLISILDRADFIHLQPSLPFVAIGTSLGFYSIKNKKILIPISLLYAAITIWWLGIFYKGHLSNKIFFYDTQTYQTADKIKKYTKTGDKIFIYGAQVNLYQLTQTLPAGDIFVFQFPWFLRISENRVLDGIKKDNPKIIVFDKNYQVEEVYLKDFSNQIYQYIESNYKKIDNIGSVDILERK